MRVETEDAEGLGNFWVKLVVLKMLRLTRYEIVYFINLVGSVRIST
jgi:hypothetical protein